MKSGVVKRPVSGASFQSSSAGSAKGRTGRRRRCREGAELIEARHSTVGVFPGRTRGRT
ncbi:hypothetical protein GA0115235_11736 [Streptomyces sp. DpondAA-F4a]|nr:hypothetical protein GA0115235_11736 [Streptomyces sp. DpondAA-F4a]SCM13030.1 hypothetical protein SAMN04883147_109124 [Streptomyces sp. DpondAA-F4]